MTHPNIVSSAHQSLETFSREAATTSLEILRAIEETVTVLVRECDETNDLIRKAHEMQELIEQSQGPIDPDDNIVEQLESAEAAVHDIVDLFKKKRQAALSDPELRGDHEESVTNAYEDAIDRYCTLHDVLCDLRWHLMEHDADHDNVILGAYDNPADLLAELDRD